MNNSTKTIMRFAGKVAGCVITAAASAAGTTLWCHVLRPKVLDAIDQRREAHKNPIGFRVD